MSGVASEVPVLMYHRITTQTSKVRYEITAEALRAQLLAIKAKGFQGASVAAVLDASPPSRPVVITFDDGAASDLAVAAPILREFDYSATFFLNTGWMASKPGYMTWDEVGALHDQGFDIQLHGRTHRFLDARDPAVLEDEVGGAVEDLRRNLGIRPRMLSFPGGRFSASSVDACRRHGLYHLFGSVPGNWRPAGNARQVIPRRVIHQGISIDGFERILQGSPVHLGISRAGYEFRRSVRGVLGNSTYQSFWARFINRSVGK